MDQTINKWNAIYSEGLSGSYMRYPSENLVTLFMRFKNQIKSFGKCLDYGFGSAANSEFLIEYFDELYGIEVSEKCLDIAGIRLSKYINFQAEKFLLSHNQIKLEEKLDLIVAWDVLFYGDYESLIATIKFLSDQLKTEGLIMATLLTSRDLKVKFSNHTSSMTRQIDSNIPLQQGCLINVVENEDAIEKLFEEFELIDFGYYERRSYKDENTMSVYYIVAKKL